MANKARLAYGSLANIDSALAAGTIDAYDILFLKDGDTARIGWIDKDGQKVIVENGAKSLVHVDELPTSDGDSEVIYIYNNEAYIWDGEKCVSISKSADLSALEEQIATKVDEATVDSKIDQAALEEVAYEISSKPEGTLVDYRKKEIRVMCPKDTKWVLQNSGEGSNPNRYYIGMKAYAPEGANSFKEDIAETISDETMYYFEDNEFAGIDKHGRKYSIVWFPAAIYDPETETWTYQGAQSTVDKYKGWYYSVEWYDANEKIIASDCIRLNLSNEECHTNLEPFYISDAIQSAKDYTDERVSNVTGVIEIVEF